MLLLYLNKKNRITKKQKITTRYYCLLKGSILQEARIENDQNTLHNQKILHFSFLPLILQLRFPLIIHLNLNSNEDLFQFI